MAQVLDKADRAGEARIDLDDPSLYVNRELSMIQFNQRVLAEALDQRHPLLGRSSPSAASYRYALPRLPTTWSTPILRRQ